MIPTHEEVMLPLLTILGDGKVHSLCEIADRIAEEFAIDDQARKQLLPSGKYPVFRSRVSWAKTYMGKAKLLETPKKAHYRITSRGEELLNSTSTKIDKSLLMQFPEFIDFITPSKEAAKTSKSKSERQAIDDKQTPVEAIEAAHARLDDQLRKDMMTEVLDQSPEFFEKLVVDLLLQMGYGGSRKDAGAAIGKSSDGGIDGTINEDKLGLDVIYLQAKRYTNPVPISHVRDFAGALMGKRARKGILVTTSTLPSSAYNYVSQIEHKIILIDGERLTRLMVDHHVGVSVEQTFQIKKIHSDYYSDE